MKSHTAKVLLLLEVVLVLSATTAFPLPFFADLYSGHSKRDHIQPWTWRVISRRQSLENHGDDPEENAPRFSPSMIPRFPKSVEDLALEASQACVEMIQNEGNERVRIDIKGVEKFGGGREFNRLIGQFIALLSQRGTGFKKIRVVFATEGLAAAAGPHLRPLPGGAALQSAVLDDDAPLGREVDGGGGGGGNDDAGGAGLLVLVRPSNNAYAGGNWENMDRVQQLVLESGAAGVPVLMVNPELRNYMGHPPMLLDDFAPAFFFDRWSCATVSKEVGAVSGGPATTRELCFF
uniref:DUF1995 domain-containing protein n=1 Tax=Heterosigma akashiwo TaxID=2829 RepID=A0A7S4D5V0_HETAK